MRHKIEASKDVPKHKKKRGKKRPFIVEAFSPNPPFPWRKYEDWFRYSRYETKERAEQAVLDLTKSHANIRWQFRIKEGDET